MQRLIVSIILSLLLIQGGANLLRLGHFISLMKVADVNADHYVVYGLGILSLGLAIILVTDIYNFVRTNQMKLKLF